MITVEHLTKTYAATVAVNDISFTVAPRETVGFLGPNGAGKSTTLKVLTCFHAATSGRVLVDGIDVAEQPEAVKRRIGYLPENVPLYPEMRIEEYLRYRAGLKGVSAGQRNAAVRTVMERCHIDHMRHRLIGQLSKGYRQRTGLADALVADPPILILDEPTIGLDPGQIREVRELIRELGRERTVLLSSHILPEVEAVCHRVIIINRGKIAESGRPDELRSRLDRTAPMIEMEVKDSQQRSPQSLRAIDGIQEVAVEQRTDGVVSLRVSLESGRDVRECIFDTAVRDGFKILSMVQRDPSLEDVFVDIITSEIEDEDACAVESANSVSDAASVSHEPEGPEVTP